MKELPKYLARVAAISDFPTPVGADKIIVLDHGKIIETGTHQQLLSSQGRYAQLQQEQLFQELGTELK